jgi:uncharacterized membrane protein YhhN
MIHINENIITLSLFAVIAVAHLAFILLRREYAQAITKVMIIPPLLCSYYFSAKTLLWTVILAGVMGWIGDIFLNKIFKNRFFLIGLLCFLVGHILYIISMFQNSDYTILEPVIALFAGIPVAALAVFLFKIKGKFRFPIFLYSSVIAAMLFSALMFFIRDNSKTSGLFVFTGACLFVVSDSILALKTLGPEPVLPRWSFILMLTYVMAQAGIITGLAMR